MPHPAVNHRVEYHLDIARFLGATVEASPGAWGLFLTPEERREGAWMLGEAGVSGGYFCLHPGSRVPLKRWESGRYAALRAGLFDEGLPRDDRIPAKQAKVTVLGNMPSTLFIAQRPRALTPGDGMVPYFNASSELFITRDLQEGDAYGFRYEPYVAGEPMTDALASRLPAERLHTGHAVRELRRSGAHTRTHAHACRGAPAAGRCGGDPARCRASARCAGTVSPSRK